MPDYMAAAMKQRVWEGKNKPDRTEKNTPYLRAVGECATKWRRCLELQGESWGLLHLEDDVRNLGATSSWRWSESERGCVM